MFWNIPYTDKSMFEKVSYSCEGNDLKIHGKLKNRSFFDKNYLIGWLYLILVFPLLESV